MTTRLAYRIQSVIDYDSLSFNPDAPEPLPDAMYQYPVFEEILGILGAHLDNLYPPEEVFRSSNTFICYDPSNLNVRVGPDFYAAFGVDAPAIKRRRLYLPWEAGKPPDFALEIGSESTAEQDVITKREIYARIGISEYWRFDPTGGDYYGQALAGDRLVNGAYQSMDLTTEPDGVLKGYSPLLRLSLCRQDEMLKFYNHETGAYLRTLPQSQAALKDAEAALSVERVARQDTEAALSMERVARQDAEARIRQLEEELHRRRMES